MKLEDMLRAIDQQIQVLSTVVQDMETAIASIKALEEKGEGMVPIGAGVFVPVEAKGDKLVVGVGANVFVEKNVEEAISILERRRDSARKALEQTKQQKMMLMRSK